MIVYRSVKEDFQSDVDSGNIDQIILEAFEKKLKRTTSKKEVESWWNSLQFMSRVINDDDIPDNAGIAIECQIPQTSKRIDFIISGTDNNNISNVVIIELKQWSKAELSEKNSIVKTALGKGIHETSHPSYQAWSYAEMIQDFSETVREENINLKPCAYLHNYEEDDVIRNSFYQEYIDKAPVFLKRDIQKLRSFIKRFVVIGDDGKTMYRIDNGKIRPSKQLADAMVSMINGNNEFTLIDDQKIVYETALYLTKKVKGNKKQVMIVEGGPGTGKSVVAINLLVEMTKQGLLAQYVSKNAAPRAVYQSKLTGTLTKTRFAALFQGSGKYINIEPNIFDALIVDEAHRLNAKSGMFQNYGENQIKEIIQAANCTVFFVDEDQRVTLKDIGTKDEIRKWAKKSDAEIHEYVLPSQFRCNGSDGYLAFLDNSLQIRETANVDLETVDFDFRVVDDPHELVKLISDKNKTDNKSRVVAGYCWDWRSKKDPAAMDIIIPQYEFSKQWNLTVDGSLWILQPESVDQIGCIHTCQGLELNYVGVIIGNDLIVRDGEMLVDPSQRSRMDATIKGYKTMLRNNPQEAKERIKTLIKNTYKTLMSRGQKGCFIYCTDDETKEYFKKYVLK